MKWDCLHQLLALLRASDMFYNWVQVASILPLYMQFNIAMLL